ncbi:hypothetical protein QX215_19040 [Chryseobacterium gambrini]|nr:hypothetical protein [Chryseobacterium gambrini]MDN4031604.1 hypothetical protein [Chryseobacterium gambrini]
MFKLISELTAKGTKDNVKANFQDNQSAQKNKNQRFLKTIVSFLIYNDQLLNKKFSRSFVTFVIK